MDALDRPCDRNDPLVVAPQQDGDRTDAVAVLC
ncbi:MAG: hypothetical protein JWN72_395 [Thermoleophilia bacterium]|nr:hypothetical protein [Thermoleophilia bacterium]